MLITALESVETDRLTLAYVTGRLLEHEQRLAKSGKPASSESRKESGKSANLDKG